MNKSKAKNLTDAICRNLPRLDKRYYKKGDYPGLEFWIHPSGKKSWYFQYRYKVFAVCFEVTLLTKNHFLL